MRIPQIPDVQWQLTDIGDERFAAAAAQEVTAATGAGAPGAG